MLYQSKTSLEPIPSTINILLLFAFAGVLLTAVQALLIVFQGDIICLNEGCRIVENLTTVPPLIFNLAGCFYFLVIFWLLWKGKNRDRGMLKFARLLLLTGMAVEGVLVSFQYYIAEVFCSYCVMILALVLILNLLMGIRQVFAGVVFFGAVVIAFSSLEFTARSETGELVLADGTYGRLERQNSGDELYLFFSSTCPHCEEVIETIDADFSCSLNFNPIDLLPDSPLAELTGTTEYSPSVNRRFLMNLGLNEIPVLTIKGQRETRVLKGKQRILEYLDGNCRSTSSGSITDYGMSSETSSQPGQGFQYLTPGTQEDGCSVDVDCDQLPDQEQ